MWPSDGDYGVRLEYGHPGGALYAPGLSLEGSWIYPRLHSNSLRWKATNHLKMYSGATRLEINDSARLPLDYSRRQLSKLVPDSFIPSEVVSDALREVKALNRKTPSFVDPLQGNLLDFGYLRDHTNDRRRKCCAFAGGVNTTILHVATVVDGEYELDAFRGSYLELPVLGAHHAQLDIKEPILGLKFAGYETSDSVRAVLSVRTQSGVSFYRPGMVRSEMSRNQLMTIDLMSTITAPQFSTFSDISFNPWYWRQFAVVDNYGKIHLREMNYTNTGVPKPHFQQLGGQEQVEAPERHRVLWGANLNNLIMSNSRNVLSFDLRAPAGNAPLRYAPRKSSRIIDVHNVGEKRNEMLVVTTDDLIWMDLRMFPKESLAWKHYRDHDPELKCSSFVSNDDTYALLYSTAEPLVTCYQFGMRDKLPFSCEDPYIFSANIGPRVLDLVPLPAKLSEMSEPNDHLSQCSFMTMYQFSMDYSLTQRLYCSDNTGALQSLALDVWADADGIFNDAAALTDFNDPEPIIAPRTVNLHPLYEKVFPEEDKTLVTLSAEQVTRDVCGRIWRLFTENTNQTLAEPASLFELVDYTGVADDLSVFAAGLRELAEALEREGYGVYDCGLQNSAYSALNGLDAQANYERLLAIWVRSLPTASRTVFREDENGDTVEDGMVRPVPAKVRLRRERIARRIAGNIAMESVVVAPTTRAKDVSADENSAEFALRELAQFVKFRSKADAKSNAHRLAAGWIVGDQEG
ncbi:RNA polymerase I-specific transcription-initiation factor-domain-containing protein [Myxozyma melibiosi]|uniref:RNA polymerase I-specific transcription-initiation factor-domain-containing protein n=1 Tax=Myxozyma melibiosi TaxID=54550 RepID=A0ABR1F659_9ASCO